MESDGSVGASFAVASEALCALGVELAHPVLAAVQVGARPAGWAATGPSGGARRSARASPRDLAGSAGAVGRAGRGRLAGAGLDRHPAWSGGGDLGGAGPDLPLVGLDGTADQKAQVAVPGRPGRGARAEKAAPVGRRRRRGTARRPGALSRLERWRRVSQTGQGRGAFSPWTAVYSAASQGPRSSMSMARMAGRSVSVTARAAWARQSGRTRRRSGQRRTGRP